MAYAERNPSSTFHTGDGEVLFCMGFSPQWQGLWLTWALVSCRLADSPHKREVLRAVRLYHKQMAMLLKARRFHTDVKSDFRPGHALVKLLGYKKYGELEDYGPEGETMTQYALRAKDLGL